MSINTLNRERTDHNVQQWAFEIGHGKSDPYKYIVDRVKVGDRGRQRDIVYFHPTEVNINLGRVAIFSDAIDDGWR